MTNYGSRGCAVSHSRARRRGAGKILVHRETQGKGLYPALCGPPSDNRYRTPLRFTAQEVGQNEAYGSRGCAASHSRARRRASPTCVAFIKPPTLYRFSTASSRASPVAREAARLNHLCACTSSCEMPWPMAYTNPRLNCSSVTPASIVSHMFVMWNTSKLMRDHYQQETCKHNT